MTTTPSQPPQNPYADHPAGFGPPQEQFPQYAQPEQGQYGAQQQPQYAPHSQDGQPQCAQQSYGQQQYQQAPYQDQGQFAGQQPFAGAAPMAPGGLKCRFCGGYPAVDATVRGHQGMIVLMRFLKLQGPFCRTCGIATVRDMTAKSLWQGWWGIGSAIVNPITMLINIGSWSKFKNLPEPAPGAPGRPLDPGKPLFKRPAILGLLIPVAILALLIVSNLNATSNADVGQCVVNKGTAADPNVKVVDCSSSDAQYRIVGKLDDTTDGSQCKQFAGVEVSYTEEKGSSKYTLCLAPV